MGVLPKGSERGPLSPRVPFCQCLEFLKGVYNARTWLSALRFDLGNTPRYFGGWTGFSTRQPYHCRGAADLEIGDTAGLETCATARRGVPWRPILCQDLQRWTHIGAMNRKWSRPAR
jgi:hypothetical protein